MFNLNFMTMKKVNYIYETTNYRMFKFLEGNRRVIPNHVQYFVKELKKNGMQIPAKVNDMNEITEGQHRFEACKQLGIPFKFFVEKKPVNRNEELDKLMSIQKGKQWRYEDVMHTQCVKGNSNYIALKSFYDKYKDFSLSSIIYISNNCSGSDFRNGKFTANQLDKADETLSFCRSLKHFFPAYNKVGFVTAINKCRNMEDFDFNFFKKKALKMSDRFYDCTHRDAFLDMILKIYNYKKSRKI